VADFEVVRSTTIAASPERVHGLIDDFHAWRAWSPWEDVDPSLERNYYGADSGVGAKYAWEGNRKAGKGSMEIVSSTPERIDLRLVFEKPWKATNQVALAHALRRHGHRRHVAHERYHKGLRRALQQARHDGPDGR
jgi:hypothetical protein